jgi:voltage-gated potassium channel Kch
MRAAATPVIVVVGSDALALATAEELTHLAGHRVAVLSRADAEFERAVTAAGATFVSGSLYGSQWLDQVGIGEAVAILALSSDDRLNLQVALRARDANPAIRIVLRQFNRMLARKIGQNLADCAVLSPAWHSAATFAAAVTDPRCFRGLQFPEPEGPLTGFTTRLVERVGVAGYTIEEAERSLAARIVAVDGDTGLGRDTALLPQQLLTLFGEIAVLRGSVPQVAPPPDRERLWRRLRRPWRHLTRINPIIARLATAVVGVFLFGTWYFRHTLGIDWLTAIYFVVTTMTTTGYGDLHPDHDNPWSVAVATLLMLSGIGFSGIFIAFGASLLTRRQWVSMQGLRHVRRRGHIVVCGAGSIGSGVIELLLGLEKPLVVVEANPDPAIVEQARNRRFDLLTGDASRDSTLDLCNLGAAHGVVALTNLDTLNLEIALGARARNPAMPVVLRIADAGFAASIARHFAIDTTFSAAALAAPAFAGLSRFDGSRGRIVIPGPQPGAGAEFAIGEFDAASFHPAALPPGAIPLAVGREDSVTLIADWPAPDAGDRVLVLVPLAPLRDGRDTLDAAAERMLAAAALGNGG